MHTALAITSILVQIVGFTLVVRQLRRIQHAQGEGYKELRSIRRLTMNPRTRISTVETPSGPDTQEQSARRLGRASSARRVVVGGDPDSALYGSLNRTPDKDDTDE